MFPPETQLYFTISQQTIETFNQKKIGQTKFVAMIVSFYGTKCKALKQKLQGKMSHGWISSPREVIFCPDRTDGD